MRHQPPIDGEGQGQYPHLRTVENLIVREGSVSCDILGALGTILRHPLAIDWNPTFRVGISCYKIERRDLWLAAAGAIRPDPPRLHAGRYRQRHRASIRPGRSNIRKWASPQSVPIALC